MTYGTTEKQRHMATAGVARRSVTTRPSTMWSIGAVALLPKTCAHVAIADFGGNATSHPRPEEAPL